MNRTIGDGSAALRSKMSVGITAADDCWAWTISFDNADRTVMMARILLKMGRGEVAFQVQGFLRLYNNAVDQRSCFGFG